MKYNKRIIDKWKKDGLKWIGPTTNMKTQFPEGWDIRDFLKEVVGEDSVIEMGCGNARLVGKWDKNQYKGYDINPSAVKEARKRFPDHSFFDYIVGDDIPSSDWMIFFTVLIHVHDDDIEEYLKYVTKNTNGVIIGEIMGRDKWRKIVKNDFCFNRDPEEYEKILSECGFTLKRNIEKPYDYFKTKMRFLVFERD